jgi:hypothetical protein
MNSHVISTLASVVVLVGWIQTATADLSAPLQQVIDTEFETVVRIEKLPYHVRKLLPSGMANPNEEFDATDVATGRPSRRLIIAGHSSQCDFVCYEHGGMGYHLHFVVFSEGKKGVQRVFEGRMLKNAKDAATVADIKSLIRSGSIPDETAQCEKHPGY